ncbi:hypothetical protein [Actinomadura madurae]|uniref:hypothetical protein n=1 Tax=Actinomadura madurae TaxID=1993 RepID=UPI0020D226BF|nr:hypothetical protein [Actinomadura madurae]MCP9979074.1 hypothetical protein [Actinomadura madurae]
MENAELAERLGSSDEWIRTRTGIGRRYVASPGTAVSDLAVEAGARALKSAGGGPADAVVLATATPDRPCPGTAPDVATRLGLWSAAAFDVAAVCSGFVYALAAGTGLIGAGIVGRVLVIGADVFSSILDPGDRATSVIFGDGAGAVVLRPGEPDEPGALGPFDLGSDGSGADLITVRAAGRGSGCPAPPPARRPLLRDGRQVGVLARRAADGPVVAGGAGPGRAGAPTTSTTWSATRRTSGSPTISPTSSACRASGR